jgi:hypothetical protein
LLSGWSSIALEITPAIPALYMRFLQCFVSTVPDRRTMSARNPFGSTKDQPTTQNAGCTMAIHASCTKAKIGGIVN